jgi:plasmid stabilization system protein ParE
MSFRVNWTDQADADLDRLWTGASDRDAVAQAAIEIDRQLTANPEAAGESREPGQRIVLHRPVGVMCRVTFEERQVFVTRVWRISSET